MSTDKALAEYISLLPAAQAFVEQLVSEISRVVPDEVKILSRIKSWDSIAARLQRQKLNNICEISDLVGIRLVVPTTHMVFQVEDAIANKFFIAARITQILQPEQSAAHFTLRNSSSLTEGISAEIQVISASEEARRTLQHDLPYKHTFPTTEPTDVLKALIAEFEALISRGDIHEKRDIHPFLNNNNFLLYQSSDAIISEVAIGLGTQFRIDFVIRKPDGTYILVELESPKSKIITKSGEFTSSVNHALRQVEDWQEWIEANLPTVEREYPGIRSPEAWVIIGRLGSLSELGKRRLSRRNINKRGHIHIRTYDDLLREAHAHVRALASVLARR